MIFGALTIMAFLLYGKMIRTKGAADAAAPVVMKDSGEAPGGDPSAVPVQVCFAARRDVPVYRLGIGSVRAANSVNLVPRVEGELVSFLFKEGQNVQVGEVLAQIDAKRYEFALRQAQAALARSQAHLASVEGDLHRTVELASRGAATVALAENQKALVAQVIADVESATSARDNAALDLENATIRAPIAGRIGLRNVDVGAYLKPTDGTIIATITQLRPIAVLFTLPEEDLGLVRQAMSQTDAVPVTALERDERTPIDTGVLLTIESQIDVKTGTFRLKAVFDNLHDRLWPGQFVNARIRVGTTRDAIIVPAQAVQRGPEGAYVFLVNARQRAEARPVRLLQVQQDAAVIDRGVSEGDRVVVAGQYRLDRGTKVNVLTNPGNLAPGDPNPCATD